MTPRSELPNKPPVRLPARLSLASSSVFTWPPMHLLTHSPGASALAGSCQIFARDEMLRADLPLRSAPYQTIQTCVVKAAISFPFPVETGERPSREGARCTHGVGPAVQYMASVKEITVHREFLKGSYQVV